MLFVLPMLFAQVILCKEVRARGLARVGSKTADSIHVDHFCLSQTLHDYCISVFPIFDVLLCSLCCYVTLFCCDVYLVTCSRCCYVVMMLL